MTAKELLSLFKEAASEWSEDKAPTLGAALAYYTVFSMAPLVVITIAIAGFVYGNDAARGQVFTQLHGFIGDQGGKAIQDLVQNAGAKPTSGLVAAITGAVTLLFGASGVFGQLQTSLNAIWGVAPRPGRGLAGLVKNRILSFGFILVVGFLLLVSLLLTAAISFIVHWMGGFAAELEILAQVFDFLLSFALVGLLFALIFKFLPDAEIGWGDVWVGAVLTAMLFSLGKFALGLYLGMSSVSSSFGAAGSLIILLLWVYYSSQILFFGAEFTKVWANHCGSRVKPSKDAVAIGTRLGASAG